MNDLTDTIVLSQKVWLALQTIRKTKYQATIFEYTWNCGFPNLDLSYKLCIKEHLPQINLVQEILSVGQFSHHTRTGGLVFVI